MAGERVSITVPISCSFYNSVRDDALRNFIFFIKAKQKIEKIFVSLLQESFFSFSFGT